MKRVQPWFAAALLLITSWPVAAQRPRWWDNSSGIEAEFLSPAALACTPDGRTLFVACRTAKEIIQLDLPAMRVVRHIAMPEPPSGLAISAEGSRLFASCEAPKSPICVLDVEKGVVSETLHGGHTALSPVISPDGKVLYVCYRFENAVAAFDVSTKMEIARITVDREPVCMAITPDGKHLFTANHLPAGRSDLDVVSARVSVIDTETRRVVKRLALANGATLLQGIRCSPDGKCVAVAHSLARFHLPTFQPERGWVNNNALTLIDSESLEIIETISLDNVDAGAGNPWAVGWDDKGTRLCVTHAGTHELSILNAPALMDKISKRRQQKSAVDGDTDPPASEDLFFLGETRRRIKLPGNGPRSIVIRGNTAIIGNYFSDSLCAVDISSAYPTPVETALGSGEMSDVRLGEMLFNDASISLQGWHSCASCHSSDARVDGLNWDLPNDGVGNPKNARSLLFSFQTPPSMSLGVRANAGAAIRAGLRGTLFSSLSRRQTSAIDRYVLSLQPVPSPSLEDGATSRAAERGRELFFSPQTACAACHRPPLFTDSRAYDVGTNGKFDRPDDKFYTPGLVEIWRTAPYLHDGSAASLRDVLTIANRSDRHGQTAQLTGQQIEDLLAFLLSL